MKINLRVLEKSDKFGYLFFIAYNGIKFDAFDEIKNKHTVKGDFSKILLELGFSWAKGVQQAGRTDAKVSADENILYISSRFSGDLEKIKTDFNSKSQHLKIKKIIKTLPNLVIPDEIEMREYLYSYPKKRVTLSEDEIVERCKNLSGTYDVSRFTDSKGKELKEHIRDVKVTYESGKLRFLGNSFMPKQVRIMSSYILTDSYEPLPGKYLKLEKIYVKKELEDMYIIKNNEISQGSIEQLEFAEKVGNEANIFYVKRENKSAFIGKNGNNIKRLKKIYGDIIVREL